jgi:hypothetical protein
MATKQVAGKRARRPKRPHRRDFSDISESEWGKALEALADARAAADNLFPIAYYRLYAEVGGGATAGLLLSQMVYWSGHEYAQKRGGWFYNTVSEWEEQTYLSRYELEHARDLLEQRGLIELAEEGIPKRLWYRVHVGKLIDSISALRSGEQSAVRGKLTIKLGENPLTDGEKPLTGRGKPTNLIAEYPSLDGGKTPNKNADNPLTITENPAESTAETSSGISSETSSILSSGTSGSACGGQPRFADSAALPPERRDDDSKNGVTGNVKGVTAQRRNPSDVRTWKELQGLYGASKVKEVRDYINAHEKKRGVTIPDKLQAAASLCVRYKDSSPPQTS